MGAAVACRGSTVFGVAKYEPTREQRDILRHPPDRSGRVLAGPGTGKSATVVSLASELLKRESAPKIRLLTFTRAAGRLPR